MPADVQPDHHAVAAPVDRLGETVRSFRGDGPGPDPTLLGLAAREQMRPASSDLHSSADRTPTGNVVQRWLAAADLDVARDVVWIEAERRKAVLLGEAGWPRASPLPAPEPPTICKHGERSYSRDGVIPVTVTDEEDGRSRRLRRRGARSHPRSSG